MALKLSAPPTADVLLTAFEKHVDEMRGLEDRRLLTRVNFDFPAATAIVLGAQPVLLGFRQDIHDELPKIPLRYVDELDSITHAALHVYMQSLTAPTPESKLVTLVDQSRSLRKKLQADAMAAVAHELMDPSALDGIPTGNGRLEIAQGVLGLCVAFRASWPRMKGKTALTEEMLTEATQAAVALLSALGRDTNPSLSGEAEPTAALWNRAVSLFFYAYDQCRRAMSHLRWDEGDAADFAPSILAHRGSRATKSADATPDASPASPTDPATNTPQSPNVPGVTKPIA